MRRRAIPPGKPARTFAALFTAPEVICGRKDTDSLHDAIDVFCQEGRGELPVVDADGDLVGLVSGEKLLRRFALVAAVMAIAALGSAFVDNVILVTAFIPVVQDLVCDPGTVDPLSWSLLFGACVGGNITMIGSTANILALGMLEKRYRIRIDSLEWVRVGLAAGIVACLVSWLGLSVARPLMIAGAS